MWTKASRGLTNILTGYGEVLYQPAEREKTERWPLAGMAGLFKGVYRGTLRTAAGVIELATFPIPLPRGYEPLMGPEFVVPLADPPSGEKKTDWGT
ncbi:MAG: exosortase system-associated protein, TIGR04073 family [Candidatus Omnitrophota bacterium]